MKNKKKMEFTKKMYLYNVIFVTIIVAISFVSVFLSGMLGIMDFTYQGIATSAAFAELAIHTAFVVWKAKVENCRKYKDVNRLNNLLKDDENDESEVVG